MSQTLAPATGATAAPPGRPAPDRLESGMTHRQVLETLSGLLLGMFVAILSSTVVSNALPTIVNELNGSESGYTWVVTATLLATTISTPIWGKLSDLVSKKLLVQLALVIFAVSSMAAGLSQNMAMLITMRVFQGLGAGGLTSLSQVILATIVSPRERGRYSGYLGATFALGTVAGPLIGGAITEHISWRWCFYVGVPFAALAIIVLQKTLHLPTRRREVHIDYLGAILLAAGVSSLLVWVSLAGENFDWWSWQTGAMVGGGIVLLALTVMAEQIAPEPMIPLRLFRNQTIVLASLASLFVGIAMFAGTVFLSQYFQLARAESPMTAGIMTMPLILGLFLSSTVSGQVITRTGRWKAWLCGGGFILTAGLGLLGSIHYDTGYWVVAAWMLLVGVGIGMMMQNLVLAVQNEVPPSDLGAASSFVAFTRSMGGAIGVSALGALLATRVKDHVTEGFTNARINPGAAGGGGLPDVKTLPEPVKSIIQDAYGKGIAEIFLAAAPFALVAFLVTLFIRETALRTKVMAEPGEESAPEGEVAEQTWNTAADHDHERRMTRAEWEQLAATTPAQDGAPTPAQAAATADDARPAGGLEVAPEDPAAPRETPAAPREIPGSDHPNGHSPLTSPVLAMAAARPAATGEHEGAGAPAGSTAPAAASVASPAPEVTPEVTPVATPVERTVVAPDAPAVVLEDRPSPDPVGGPAWRSLTGRVVRNDGEPAHQAVVTAVDAAGAPLARTVTAPNGRYRLDLPASATAHHVVVEVVLD